MSTHLSPTAFNAGQVSPSLSMILSRQGTPTKTIRTSDLKESSYNFSNGDDNVNHAQSWQTTVWLSNPETYDCCMRRRENGDEVDINQLFARLREVGLDQNQRSSGTMSQKTTCTSAEGIPSSLYLSSFNFFSGSTLPVGESSSKPLRAVAGITLDMDFDGKLD
ncbi:hypothetical protein EPUS_05467 [Endocarpon pusillum Z07020]|uniref:Uncharacterized protein n=1 Tax=Endocarpon pusillum (strain Z07020 / HMAS-L-300199) TaxID=1263415 RepID=U1GCY6_ENDPU|nr:uncharacterized protein EPUS_05467 [Endocarpon pusillum Z07020]ERF69923.1 hypothetical protein EPUS_05467 [Endocarpon pusillum Z07020]